MQVLLVDDNEELREFLIATLRENDIEAVGAASSDAAVRLINESGFDGLVVDSTLGESDGVALVLQLRNTKNGRGVPALLMSAINTALARRMAQNANCQFLAKPFGPTSFVEQVRALR